MEKRIQSLFLLWFIAAIVFAVPGYTQSDDCKIAPPKPNPFVPVVDYTGEIDEYWTRTLTAQALAFEKRTGTQVEILAVGPSDYSTKERAVSTGNCWGIGREGSNRGLVIMVAQTHAGSHRIAIATGYGMEGELPDVTCGRILDSAATYYNISVGQAAMSALQGCIAQLGWQTPQERAAQRALEDAVRQRRHDELKQRGLNFFLGVLALLFGYSLWLSLVWWYQTWQKRREWKASIEAMKGMLPDYSSYPDWAVKECQTLMEKFRQSVDSYTAALRRSSRFSNQGELSAFTVDHIAPIERVFQALQDMPEKIRQVSIDSKQARSKYADKEAATRNLHIILTQQGFYLDQYDDEPKAEYLRLYHDRTLNANQEWEALQFCRREHDKSEGLYSRLLTIQTHCQEVEDGTRGLKARLHALFSRYTEVMASFKALQELCTEDVWETYNSQLTDEPNSYSATCLEDMDHIRAQNSHEVHDYATAYTLWKALDREITKYETVFGGGGVGKSWVECELERQTAAKDDLSQCIADAEEKQTTAKESLGLTGSDSENYTTYKVLSDELDDFSQLYIISKQCDWSKFEADVTALGEKFDKLKAEAESDSREHYAEIARKEEEERQEKVKEENDRLQRQRDNENRRSGGGSFGGGGAER